MAKKKSQAEITFEANTSQFDAAIKDSNKVLSQLKAELKLNAEQMKTNGKSVDSLEDKHALLEQQLEASKDKVDALANKVDEASANFGENADKTEQLKKQLTYAKIEYEKVQQEINKCNKELEEQKAIEAAAERATEDLTDENDKLKTSTKKMATEVSKSGSSFSDTSGKADKLERSVDDAGNAAEDAEGGFTVLKGVIADLASEAIQMAIGKISEFVSYLKDLPEQTMELRQSFSTLETAFDNVGFSTHQAEKTWKDLYAVFGDDQTAVEAANHIARMSRNQKDLNSWVKISTGLYATYQDAINPAGIAEAAKETAACGKVTGQFADALNWSSEAAELFAAYMSEDVTTAEDAFNVALANCSTEQERQALITETLTLLYGDAAEKYEETAEGQIKAKEATADLKVAENKLAEAIEPVTTKFTELKTSLMEQFRPAIETVSGLMLDALEWAEAHPGAIQAIAIAAGVLATAFGALAITVGALTAAQWALNNAFITNPMTWVIVGIVAAVAALAVGLVKAYQECEWFRDIINKIGEAFKWVGEKLGEFIGAVKEDFNKFKSWITPILEPVLGRLRDIIDDIGWYAGLLGKKIAALFSPFKEVGDFIAGVFNTGLSQAKESLSNIHSVVKSFVENALTNLYEKLGEVFNWLENGTITEFLFNFVGALQPLVIMIKDNLLESLKSLEEPINKIKEAFEKVWSAISEHLIPVLQDILVPLWENVLKPIFSVIAGAIGGTVVGAIGLAIGAFNGICEAIAGFGEFLGGLAEIVGACFDLIVGIFTLDGEKCLGAINDIWDGVCSVFGGLWDGVSEGLQGFWDGVVGFFTSLWDTLVGHSIVPDTINGVIDCFGGLWDGVKDFVSGFVDNVVGFFTGLWENVTGTASDIKDGVCNAFIGLKDGASNIWQNIKSGASNIWGNICSFVTGKSSDIKEGATKNFNSMKNSITTVSSTIKDKSISAFNTMKDKTASAFNTAKTKAVSSYNSLKSSVVNTASSAKASIANSWSSVQSKTASSFSEAKNKAVSNFNSMESSISSSANAAKSAATTAFNSMKSSISNGVSDALSTVSNKFGNIKTKISDTMNSAKNTVKNGISSITSFFSNMKIKIPDIKMPHFSLSGKFSLSPPSVPKLKVSWYADGGIFTKPTLFNTPYGLKGVGEAGAEAVLPIDRLEGYISGAIEKTMQRADIQALAAAVEDLANRPTELYINGRKFAYATASDSDSMSGLRSTLKSRGLALD